MMMSEDKSKEVEPGALAELLNASSAESVKLTPEDAAWLNQKPQGKESV
jgi:hypothetical protein